MNPTPQTRTHPAGSSFSKPRLPKRQTDGTVRVQQAFPERAFEAILGSHQAAFTTLAFDCNPTHFVTPQGHPVTHNAFAPRRLCPIVVRHIWPSGGGDTASGARLPPPFELTPRRDFPSARCSPARALFFVCAIRTPARVLPTFPHALDATDPSIGFLRDETRSYKGKSTPRRLPR